MNPAAPDQSSRIALVTGASRGVGRAAALALAQSGAHVVALARTQGALEELDDEIRALRPDVESPATLVPLDLKDSAAIDRLGEALYRRWGRLDAMVGNAGILGVLSPLHHVNPKDWDDVLAVNVTANWRLIRSLDPLLRRSVAGRVVFVTSDAANSADLRAYWGPYAMSKAALDAIARTYAAETVNTSNVRVMLVNPGPLRTLMRAKAMPGEDPATLRTPQDLAPKIVELCSPEWTSTGKLYDFPTELGLVLPRPRIVNAALKIVNGASGLCAPAGEAKRRFRSEPEPQWGVRSRITPPRSAQWRHPLTKLHATTTRPPKTRRPETRGPRNQAGPTTQTAQEPERAPRQPERGPQRAAPNRT